MTDPARQIRRRLSEMNEAQTLAIDSIVGGWEGQSGRFVLPIVDGPPGTGKTTVGVLGSSRFRLESTKPQVSYLAYTHLAADRALQSFIDLGFTPDDVLRVVDRIRARRYRGNPFYVGFDRLEDLTPNQQRRLKNTPILITTLLSARRILPRVQTRSLIVIDEFSQVPPSLFFSTLRTTVKGNPRGYALLGDPNQLPVLTTQPALRPNIGSYIMARRGMIPHQLRVQYRMHDIICQEVNALRMALNAYPLESDATVRERTLASLGYRWNQEPCPPGFEEIISPENPLVLVNTDSLPDAERQAFMGSKFYTAEARLAARLAEGFARCYATSSQPLIPRILTPYSAQVGAITGLLSESQSEIDCGTVYGAQGNEYPLVIVSFVRKNPGKWIGFLEDPQLHAQTYVACSRAMGKLVILLSRSTFQGHRDFDFLISQAEQSGMVLDADPAWVT